MSKKRTAFYNIHKSFQAKIVDFAGFEMPIQYKSVLEEHKRVRTTVGIFDVSHMGQFEIRGENAEKFLQYMTINDVSTLTDYKIQYSAMCYDDGGIVDDLLVYHYPDYYLVVVNAANIEKDFLWMQQHLLENVIIENKSDVFSLLALQGRNAVHVLKNIVTDDIDTIRYYTFAQMTFDGISVMISRTGYTGEDGFELMFPVKYSEQIWDKIMDAGKPFDIEPIGLAARDTLRIEMKYCLYGNDIDHTTHPLEAGLGWITHLEKPAFCGRDALIKAKKEGLKRKLVGFELFDKFIARKGYEIGSAGRCIGYVTSGAFSPILNKSIGIGYVDIDFAKVNSEIDVVIRGKNRNAKIVKTPFYKRPY